MGTSLIRRFPFTGKRSHDTLTASYHRLAGCGGTAYTVHFDDYEEQVRNPRTAITSPSYHCAVLLVEA